MIITITANEQKILQIALDEYRRRKGAERMLRGQKDNTQYAKYDALIKCVEALEVKVKDLT